MQTATFTYLYSARTTYTAIKRLFRKENKFSSVDCNDELFVIEARHGAFLSPFSENVKIKVVATSAQSSKVTIESSSRSWLNLLNFGANKGNVSDLSDFINNEVYRLQQHDDIPISNTLTGRPLKFRDSNVKMK